METKVKAMVDEEIETRMEELKTFPVDSKEYAAAVSSLKTLEEIRRHETDAELNEQKFIQQVEETNAKNKVEWWKACWIPLVACLAPLFVHIWEFCVGLIFEENGTFRSTTMRNVYMKIFKK